jgi:protein-S-isoprenylcysteine O-methyltransferase Ste14
MFLILASVLLVSAGTVDWLWGWVYLGIYLLSVLANSYFLLRLSPETIVERSQPKEMRDWDKLVGGLWSLAHFVLLPLVAGLDLRFGWTQNAGLVWHIAGAVGFATGLALFGWAMITNSYFSREARIQVDQGQTVCRDGPYRHVRHPGYIGAIIQSFAVPLLLGSWWSLLPGAMAALMMVVRTSLEDRMLQSELPGYAAYAAEVRFRLVPQIW